MTKIPETLQDVTLFSKYIGLKRATDTIVVNYSLFAESFSDEETKRDCQVMNEQLQAISDELSLIVEEHRQLFLERYKRRCDGATTSPSFRNMFLSITYMTRGDINACLMFLADLFECVEEGLSQTDKVIKAVEFTKDLVKGQYLTPKTFYLDESGMETDEPDEDMEDAPISKIRLSLTDAGHSEIFDVIAELDSRSGDSNELVQKLSLLQAESPSRMLN